MDTIILSGRDRSKQLTKNYKIATQRLKEKGVTPKLVVMTVGEDPASKVYVGQKEKRAHEIGMDFEWATYPETISQDELISEIEKRNNDDSVNGIIVQLPVPDHLDDKVITESIKAEKDVDGFHPINIGRLVEGKTDIVPCTPKGILNLLDYHGIDLEGKQAVMVGRSQIVGFPMMVLMTHRNATVTLCHSRTPDLKRYLKDADVVVVAVGSAELIKTSDLKEGAVVVDVGMNRLESGKLVGDVDYDEVSEIASAITPVPGGVGPMTVAMLMEQTIQCACKQNGIDFQEIMQGLD